jgi:hypothetical protein
VSNFYPEHIERLITETGVVPVINQIELHPDFQQKAAQEAHKKLNIATQSWSPLGQGKLIDHPVIGEIAGKHGKTPAQVIIRWHMDSGLVVIPKSVTPSRIEENFQVFDFKLDGDDMASIAKLDNARRPYRAGSEDGDILKGNGLNTGMGDAQPPFCSGEHAGRDETLQHSLPNRGCARRAGLCESRDRPWRGCRPCGQPRLHIDRARRAAEAEQAAISPPAAMFPVRAARSRRGRGRGTAFRGRYRPRSAGPLSDRSPPEDGRDRRHQAARRILRAAEE